MGWKNSTTRVENKLGFVVSLTSLAELTDVLQSPECLEFVDEPEKDDQIFENQGIKIIVDPKSLVYISGTEMDFVKQGVNEGFEFRNPNAKGECGCGESFNV